MSATSQWELDTYRPAPHLAKGFQGLGQLQPSLLMPCASTEHRGKENHLPSKCQEPVRPEIMDRNGGLPERTPACDLVTHVTGCARQGAHSSVEEETRVRRRGMPSWQLNPFMVDLKIKSSVSSVTL